MKERKISFKIFLIIVTIIAISVIVLVVALKNNNESKLSVLVDMFKQAQKDNCTNDDGECANRNHLHIGDYIDYNPIATGDTGIEEQYSYKSLQENNGYEEQLYSINNDTEKLNWIVLGISDDGKNLLITTDSPIRPEATNNPEVDVPFYKLDGFNGYIHAIDELNNISKIYGNGDCAEFARSISLEDLDKLVGYNPNIEKWSEGKLYEYKNKITIKSIGNGKYQYSSTNGVSGTLIDIHDKGFYYIENGQEKILPITDTKNSIELECTEYSYNAKDLIDVNSRIYQKFFNTSARRYWVAKYSFTLGTYNGGYGIHTVSNGDVNKNGFIFTKGDKFGETKNVFGYGIRPVIVLKSNITTNDVAIIEDQELNGEWKTIY